LLRVIKVRPANWCSAPVKLSRADRKLLVQLMTTALAVRASATSILCSAPAATSDAARWGVRFHTVVGCPAASKAPASARPIEPIPSTVTVTCRAAEVVSVRTVRGDSAVSFTGTESRLGQQHRQVQTFLCDTPPRGKRTAHKGPPD